MEVIKIQYYTAPFGELILGSCGDRLCLCDWRYRKMRASIDRRLQRMLSAEYEEQQSEVIDAAVLQLDEYFAGARKEFDIPLLFAGTDFQKTVWNALLKVPYGNVCTYGDLSKAIGNASAVRAVAGANGANAISIIVPCHRIIGGGGKLTGYAGGIEAKKKLLELEAAAIWRSKNCSPIRGNYPS